MFFICNCYYLQAHCYVLVPATEGLWESLGKGGLASAYEGLQEQAVEAGRAKKEAGISASPAACPSRGYGRAGTQNDHLGEAVILSAGAPIPAQRTCRQRCRDRAKNRSESGV